MPNYWVGRRTNHEHLERYDMLLIALTALALAWVAILVVVLSVCIVAGRGDRALAPATPVRRPARARLRLIA
jgi:hypothetical protein